MYELSDNLLFSFEKEYAKPSSSVGKVWRVYIRSGALHVGDGIRITSVNLQWQPDAALFDIEAEVKSMREELDVIEGIREVSSAYAGSIVGIDIKNCYCNKKKINKKDILTTKQSIGFAFKTQFKHYDEFYIKFTDAEKAFDLVEIGQSVVLLWFGKRISARVVKIPDSVEGMYVKLLDGRRITVPDDYEFRNSDIMRKIIIFVEHGGEHWYISGFFEFES